MNRAARSSLRVRRQVLKALLAGGVAAVSGAMAGPQALAQSQRERSGRLDPGERDRLRREIREQGARDPSQAPPGRRPPAPGGGRLSEAERQQLRRQLREAGGRRQ